MDIYLYVLHILHIALITGVNLNQWNIKFDTFQYHNLYIIGTHPWNMTVISVLSSADDRILHILLYLLIR